MVQLTIRDLIDLVASEVTDPQARLEKVFEWSYARHLELVRWLLTSAVALFAPAVVAFAKGELTDSKSSWWLALTLFSAVGIAVFGLLMLVSGKRRYGDYLAAQALLGEIKKIAPFLARYRQELESK